MKEGVTISRFFKETKLKGKLEIEEWSRRKPSAWNKSNLGPQGYEANECSTSEQQPLP